MASSGAPRAHGASAHGASAHGAFVHASVLGAAAVFTAVAAACSGPAMHDQAATTTGAGGGPPVVGTGGVDAGAPVPDADGSPFCGSLVHTVTTDPPNLYFLFDASGSMNDLVAGFSKYELVTNSAIQIVQMLGSLINVGAAVLPFGASDVAPCAPGQEVFPVAPGDPIGPMTGPTTGGFIQAINVTPTGGTPTAVTLTALRPMLAGLRGRTVVLLATDGGPNCNAQSSCSASQCVPNIEGMCTPPGANCCAPGGLSGPTGCIDETATVAAVKALADAKIPVVVVGVPGSADYADVLDAMAQAGGAPQQPGPPSYYPVDDLGTLSGTFQQIAQSFISCDVTISPAPPSSNETNVYFDGKVVVQDPQNGWMWKSPGVVELEGSSCDELKNGQVKEIVIVSGCPTQKM